MNEKLLVIVIEDDVDMAETYRKMISIVPYAEAEVIHNGAEGLHRLAQDPVGSLIILDLHLPEVEGITILEALQRDPRWLKTIKVVITVDTQLANVITGSDMDVDGVLIKPVDVQIFHRFIAKAAVANHLPIPAD